MLLDVSVPEVALVNRFWKMMVTGTAAGAIIAAYLYSRSRKGNVSIMKEDSSAEETAVKLRNRVMRTTNRFIRDVGKELSRAGWKIQAIGKRLNMGGAD